MGMKVVLLTAWKGHEPGEQVTVSLTLALALIDAGVASGIRSRAGGCG
jgi:hypothetical protein